jgi:hypothetical protein
VNVRLNDYHNAGRVTFTSKGIPWVLKYKEEFDSEIEAMRREKQSPSTKPPPHSRTSGYLLVRQRFKACPSIPIKGGRIFHISDFVHFLKA